jgi:hypothetical protein
MSGSLVADLGLGPEIWLFLTFLATLTLFFKFGRVWCVRNLDLLLLFAPALGLMRLVGSGSRQPWDAFFWLFLAAAVWLARCLLDLGLSRRPLLEPNLTVSGLWCAAIGLLGLLLAEAIALPVDEGAARNPSQPEVKSEVMADLSPGPPGRQRPVVEVVLQQAPLPASLKRNPPQVIVGRVLAGLAHLGVCAAVIAIGVRHFERPIAGLAIAVCYLVSPYTRIAVVDCGQILPAALIATAVLLYRSPVSAGALIGLAGGWMPACLGLIPLWFGFYPGRRRWRFAVATLAVVALCAALGYSFPTLAEWARALGARSLAEAGLIPGIEDPRAGSFWTGIDPAFRLPILIAYAVLVLIVAIWPVDKNLGELIALSAGLLIASQFWYLEEGGTMIVLELPLILLMVFRPNLNSKRAPDAQPRPRPPRPGARPATPVPSSQVTG